MVESTNHTVFCERVWWLSHCKYWSVWVGFLYILVARVPSGHWMTIVSRKGMDPSALVSSTVNWMLWSTEVMWSRNSSLYVEMITIKILSTCLSHRCGGGLMCWGLSTQNFPWVGWLLWGLSETPWLPSQPAHMEHKKGIPQAHLWKTYDVVYCHGFSLMELCILCHLFLDDLKGRFDGHWCE